MSEPVPSVDHPLNPLSPQPPVEPSVHPTTGVLSRVDRGAADVLMPGGGPGGAHLRADFGHHVLADAAADPSLQPVVGDDVRLRRIAEGRWLVDAVLPRRTAITRASVSPGSSHRQVLAANVDYVGVTEPVDAPAKPGRIERLLALAWESGATPLVLLTKADLSTDLETARTVARVSAPGVEVVACSAIAGTGLEVLASLLVAGTAVAFVGPSGAGKSSLVNALAGYQAMEVRQVRSDHRGRHTTVHRELLVLPSGAKVIDTPGLRSVGLTSPQALDQVFADVEEFATGCRFADCEHDTEPGCGVTSAIEAGLLDPRRLLSWRKLQREAAWLERRHDARKRAEERAKWKARSRQMRGQGRGLS